MGLFLQHLFDMLAIVRVYTVSETPSITRAQRVSRLRFLVTNLPGRAATGATPLPWSS